MEVASLPLALLLDGRRVSAYFYLTLEFLTDSDVTEVDVLWNQCLLSQLLNQHQNLTVSYSKQARLEHPEFEDDLKHECF